MAGTEQLLALPEPPDAIFAMSDLMAIATIQTLQRRGLRVPEDVAVVGFDDIRFARLVTPPLTTVRQDVDTLGRLAAETLVAMIHDRELEPPTLTVATTLVVRESTGGSTLEEDARSVLDLL
jgi:LacI family transcriptional regulator